MNAYFASFMLLLFNAVGLSVPAAAAENARVASGAEATVSSVCSAVCAEKQTGQTESHVDNALGRSLSNAQVTQIASAMPAQLTLSTNRKTGDKLEHEEGAP